VIFAVSPAARIMPSDTDSQKFARTDMFLASGEPDWLH
jgi:hypothetical protein